MVIDGVYNRCIYIIVPILNTRALTTLALNYIYVGGCQPATNAFVS